jgi:hypothetical protein
MTPFTNLREDGVGLMGLWAEEHWSPRAQVRLRSTCFIFRMLADHVLTDCAVLVSKRTTICEQRASFGARCVVCGWI